MYAVVQFKDGHRRIVPRKWIFSEEIQKNKKYPTYYNYDISRKAPPDPAFLKRPEGGGDMNDRLHFIYVLGTADTLPMATDLLKKKRVAVKPSKHRTDSDDVFSQLTAKRQKKDIKSLQAKAAQHQNEEYLVSLVSPSISSLRSLSLASQDSFLEVPPISSPSKDWEYYDGQRLTPPDTPPRRPGEKKDNDLQSILDKTTVSPSSSSVPCTPEREARKRSAYISQKRKNLSGIPDKKRQAKSIKRPNSSRNDTKGSQVDDTHRPREHQNESSPSRRALSTSLSQTYGAENRAKSITTQSDDKFPQNQIGGTARKRNIQHDSKPYSRNNAENTRVDDSYRPKRLQNSLSRRSPLNRTPAGSENHAKSTPSLAGDFSRRSALNRPPEAENRAKSTPSLAGGEFSQNQIRGTARKSNIQQGTSISKPYNRNNADESTRVDDTYRPRRLQNSPLRRLPRPPSGAEDHANSTPSLAGGDFSRRSALNRPPAGAEDHANSTPSLPARDISRRSALNRPPAGAEDHANSTPSLPARDISRRSALNRQPAGTEDHANSTPSLAGGDFSRRSALNRPPARAEDHANSPPSLPARDFSRRSALNLPPAGAEDHANSPQSLAGGEFPQLSGSGVAGCNSAENNTVGPDSMAAHADDAYWESHIRKENVPILQHPLGDSPTDEHFVPIPLHHTPSSTAAGSPQVRFASRRPRDIFIPETQPIDKTPPKTDGCNHCAQLRKQLKKSEARIHLLTELNLNLQQEKIRILATNNDTAPFVNRIGEWLNPDTVLQIHHGCAAGAVGDGRFISGLADHLWTRSELLQRSVKGKSCNLHPESGVHQQATPSKISYIFEKLKQRVDLEGDVEERRKIASRVSRKLNEKMSNLRRKLTPAQA